MTLVATLARGEIARAVEIERGNARDGGAREGEPLAVESRNGESRCETREVQCIACDPAVHPGEYLGLRENADAAGHLAQAAEHHERGRNRHACQPPHGPWRKHLRHTDGDAEPSESSGELPLGPFLAFGPSIRCRRSPVPHHHLPASS
jgi:hypothetical protein